MAIHHSRITAFGPVKLGSISAAASVRIELAVELARTMVSGICRCSHMDGEHEDGEGRCLSADPETSPCGCDAFLSAPLAVTRTTAFRWED